MMVAGSAQGAAPDSPLALSREAIAQWTQTRQLISQTRAAWESDRETLKQTQSLYERELQAVRDQLGKVSTNNSVADKERARD